MERGGTSASPEGRTFQILFFCFRMKWQAVCFFAEIAGMSLAAGALPSWKKDAKKAIAGGRIGHHPVRSCI